MGIETKFPGSNLGGMDREPPPNKRARRMLEEILRARERREAKEPYEPSRWVITAVLGTMGLILGIILLSALNGGPSRWWVLAALVAACLSPYLIGMQIVRSIRKQ